MRGERPPQEWLTVIGRNNVHVRQLAIVDSGASACMIPIQVARDLQLPLVRRQPTSTACGIVDRVIVRGIVEVRGKRFSTEIICTPDLFAIGVNVMRRLGFSG